MGNLQEKLKKFQAVMSNVLTWTLFLSFLWLIFFFVPLVLADFVTGASGSHAIGGIAGMLYILILVGFGINRGLNEKL